MSVPDPRVSDTGVSIGLSARRKGDPTSPSERDPIPALSADVGHTGRKLRGRRGRPRISVDGVRESRSVTEGIDSK